MHQGRRATAAMGGVVELEMEIETIYGGPNS